jgi:hypothetical protein
VEGRASYANLHSAPAPDEKFVTLTAAPRWRHDYTPEISSSLTGGVSFVLSPDGNTRNIVVPFARAAALYAQGLTIAELSYFAGAQPSALTAQMVRSHTVTLRGTTPMSDRYGVFVGGSVGAMHGAVIDLRRDGVPMEDFDTLLADADMTWMATEWLQFFVRGLISSQFGGGAPEATIREAVTIGIQLSTSADAILVPLRLPQRVDKSDVTPLR